MSIHVVYQPINVDLIHGPVFDYILGRIDGEALSAQCPCERPNACVSVLEPCRDAYAARRSGAIVRHPEWGRCDPTEFLTEQLVHSVLQFAQHVWPCWLVNGYRSVDLLPDEFPVLDHYQMPIALFRPMTSDLPELPRGFRQSPTRT